MRIAKEFGQIYWDGPRKFGYGGYKYDGRWKPVAEEMVKHYELKSSDNILDIGCGKGFLLKDMASCILPCTVSGIDISEYAIKSMRGWCNSAADKWMGNCIDLSRYKNDSFDLAYSINVFHNLGYKDMKQAIREMVRVGKENMYICVESYRNEEELTNLQCWALTCQSFYTPDDWKCILQENGYNSDIEFIYFT